jgi:RimJ/RimL family protein N-acetyltransferase
MTPNPPNFLIRDGIESDIAICLALDDAYRTEHVWQMSIHQDSEQTQIVFRKQRLPRLLEDKHLSDLKRLKQALDKSQCFIVIANPEAKSLIGYLTMHIDPIHQIAYLQDIVIDRPYRRNHLASRLVSIAKQWAQENKLSKIIFEIPTTNYPCIQFCLQNGFIFCGFNDQYLPNQDIVVLFAQQL